MEKFSEIGLNWGFCISGLIVGLTTGYYLGKRTQKNPPENESDEHIFKLPNSKNTYRLILGVRTDLKMQKGKVAAQCGHAAVAAYRKAAKKAPDALNKWLRYGQAKITVKIDNEEEMHKLEKMAKLNGVLTYIICDAGHTQVDPGSETVIAFGPAPKEVLDKITGHLKLY